MDTDYMRQFLVLAETLSYAEAAHRLYISQPTLSRHVMQLEEQIDARLLERSTRSVELTPIGKEAVRQFRRAVGAEDKLLAAAQGEKRRLAGHVRVGFMYHCSECLSRLLLAFESKYPDVHVSLSSSKPEELYGRFEARQLDIVQVMDGAMGEADGRRLVAFQCCPLMVLMREDNPLADCDSLRVADLTGELNIHLGEHDFLRGWLRREGFAFRGEVETDNMDVVGLRVREAGAIYITAACFHSLLAPGVTARPLLLEGRPYTMSVAYREDDGDPIVQRFAQEVRGFFRGPGRKQTVAPKL